LPLLSHDWMKRKSRRKQTAPSTLAPMFDQAPSGREI
jgi:hypothetical protein